MNKLLPFMLCCLMTVTAFGQSADIQKTVKYPVGAYTPKGDFGAYLEGVTVGLYLVPVESKETSHTYDQTPSAYDKVYLEVKLWADAVKKYRYNGKDYTDLCGVGYLGYSTFKIQVAIAGVGTKNLTVDYQNGYDNLFTLNRLYKEAELNQIKVTSFKLIEIYPKESERKDVAHCVDKQSEQAAKNDNASGSNGAGDKADNAGQSYSSGRSRQTDNGSTASQSNSVQDYINETNAKSEALDQAADQTLDAWGKAATQGKNADYISGAKPLVQEFASQGNAGAAYGTIGVAVGAQVISMLGSGKSEAKQIEEARRADFNQIKEAYWKGDVKKSLELCANFIKNYEHYPPAYFETASILRKGGNGTEKDVNTAFLLAKRAVEGIKRSPNLKKYYPQAFYLLGLMYYTGEGTEKNDEKAFECFKEAEKRDWYWGTPIGLNNSSPGCFIGYMTFMGQGTTKDERKGLKILKKYDGTAQYALGRIYYEGMGGVSKDLEQAKKYFVKAVHSFYNSNPELRAIQFLEKMYKKREFGGDDATKIMKLCEKKKESARLSEDIEAIFFSGKPYLEENGISSSQANDGELKSDEANKMVDGKMNGKWIIYHKNGKINIEESFQNLSDF